MSRRARKKEVQGETESASERVRERISLGLTLVAVSAFAIFTGYLVGQYAISWIASPLITEPISGSARLETASTQFREEESAPTAPTPASQAASASAAQPSTSSSGQASASAASSTGTAARSAAPGATAGSGSSGASQGVSMHRVQIGRYATRSEAEAVAERLRAGRPAVPDAWVLFDQAAGVYRVQAGAFTARERALELAAELSARGYEAFVVP